MSTFKAHLEPIKSHMDLSDSKNNEDIPYQGITFELIHDIYRSSNTKKNENSFVGGWAHRH